MEVIKYDNYKEFCTNNKLKILDEEMIIKYNLINKLNEIMNLDDKEKKFEIQKMRNTIMNKIYREKNKDIIKEKNKNYYENNKEIVIENNKKWRTNNKDKVQIYNKNFHINHLNYICYECDYYHSNKRNYGFHMNSENHFRTIMKKYNITKNIVELFY